MTTNTVLQVANYNSKTHSCDIVKDTVYEGQKCITGNDCVELSLNCDFQSTNTCKRDIFSSCLEDSDCVTSIKCINQLCQCVIEIFFYFAKKIL